MQNFNVSAFTGNAISTGNLHLNFKPVRSDRERKSAISAAVNVEEKEDESVSSKRYIALSKGFYTAFYTHTAGQFFHGIRKSIFQDRHFTYFPSCRFLYLRLKVFRI
ncbi:hypothetical protein GCM10011325_35170 [Dyadobacter sediminis]|nr:hypothetical protein GCM10011325_35170 [Dyadobacter sediminis]